MNVNISRGRGEEEGTNSLARVEEMVNISLGSVEFLSLANLMPMHERIGGRSE